MVLVLLRYQGLALAGQIYYAVFWFIILFTFAKDYLNTLITTFAIICQTENEKKVINQVSAWNPKETGYFVVIDKEKGLCFNAKNLKFT